MAQKYTSAGTSVNSRHLPAVYKRAVFTAPFVLDYGCGKYTAHIAEHLHGQGRALFPFDPYNQPEEVNTRTQERTRECVRHRIPVDIVCSNVLNVIDDDYVVRSIVHFITTLVAATGGTAYFTVYEGDRSGIGRKTGKDQYQRNQPLDYYVRFFDRGRVQNGMIIVH